MGALQLILLLLVVGVTAAACGWAGASVRRRNKRRSRFHFVLGFCCGSVATVLFGPLSIADARRKYVVNLGAIRRRHQRVLAAVGRALPR
jgi:hypothetical protein